MSEFWHLRVWKGDRTATAMWQRDGSKWRCLAASGPIQWMTKATKQQVDQHLQQHGYRHEWSSKPIPPTSPAQS